MSASGASLHALDTNPTSTLTTSTLLPDPHDFEPSVLQLAPLNDARFAPGHILASRYRIMSLLGRGGMGEVYGAEDLKLRQRVALKLLPAAVVNDSASLQRLIAEARIARNISHPNVCRLHDIGEADGWHYLSMEYIDGETLASLIRRVGRLPTQKALDVARHFAPGWPQLRSGAALRSQAGEHLVDGVAESAFSISAWLLQSATRGAAWPARPVNSSGSSPVIGSRSGRMCAVGLVLYDLHWAAAVQARVRACQRWQCRRSSTISMWITVDRIIGQCLEIDPADRPPSVLSVSAMLPGDPLTAALAEGRIPSPEMIAAAGQKGSLRPALAWSFLALMMAESLPSARR
jgi:serine/threonine-protein kinase